MTKRSLKSVSFPQARKASNHLANTDTKFKELIALIGPIKIKLDPHRTVFEALGTSILYQQLHGKAAAKILKRLKALHGMPTKFPTPLQIVKTPEEKLMSVGLSRAKAKAIKDLAEKVHAKAIPDRRKATNMNNLELIEAYSQVKGIGRWTAEMFLIFTLGRPDVLPIHDFGVRNGFMKVYHKRRMPTPKELDNFGTRWAPFRTAAAWYLWQATSHPNYKGKKKPKKAS